MKPLHQNVKTLGWASFFTDFSTEMIYPLLPTFLTGVLGAGAAVLGVIEGVAETTASVLKWFSGVWTDRLGRRKPFVVAGYSLAGFARPLIGLATAWPAVLVLRFLDRIGKGVRTSPRDALIADVTDPVDRGRAFGYHRSMDHAGAAVGPLVAAGLLSLGWSYRSIFLIAAVPALVVLVLLVWGLSEPKRAVRPSAVKPHTKKLPAFSDLGSNFKWLLGAVLLFTLGNSTDAFILLKLSDAGVSVSGVALLWAAHHIVKSIATYWGGRWSDRIGRRVMILAGWGVYAMVYLAFSVVQSPVWVIAVFMGYGLYFGLTEPVEKAWVTDLSPQTKRGTGFGWYHLTMGLGALPASLMFGWIWVTWSPSCAFVTGACLAGAAAVLLMFVREKAPGRRRG